MIKNLLIMILTICLVLSMMYEYNRGYRHASENLHAGLLDCMQESKPCRLKISENNKTIPFRFYYDKGAKLMKFVKEN